MINNGLLTTPNKYSTNNKVSFAAHQKITADNYVIEKELTDPETIKAHLKQITNLADAFTKENPQKKTLRKISLYDDAGYFLTVTNNPEKKQVKTTECFSKEITETTYTEKDIQTAVNTKDPSFNSEKKNKLLNILGW